MCYSMAQRQCQVVRIVVVHLLLDLPWHVLAYFSSGCFWCFTSRSDSLRLEALHQQWALHNCPACVPLGNTKVVFQ
jgi:hypothetical protein